MTSAYVTAEFKARCPDLRSSARRARVAGARWAGRERQIDTYYRIPKGRLKIRESVKGAALVWYFRESSIRSKRSDVILFRLSPAQAAKTILARELGVKVVVDKVRRLYLKENVRVHLDEVRRLGTFVEIEAVGSSENLPRLKEQALRMAGALGLRRHDLIRGSYSDLLLRTPRKTGR